MTKTFDELAAQMGLDIRPKAIKSRMRKKRLAAFNNRSYPSVLRMRKKRLAAFNNRSYPSVQNLELKRLIEQQGTLYTEAPPSSPTK